jgi:hypothetical protein
VRVRGETAVLPEAWADLLTMQISQRLRERAHAWEMHDVTAPPVDEMLDRVTALLPSAAPNALDAEIGPFYDTAGVEALLGGVSKQAVEARRRARTILALKTADGRWAYPTFQFTGGDVDPELVPAIQAFRDAPPWSAALWFVTPNPDLDDATPLTWARDGHPGDELVTSARRTAREWR